MGKTDKMSQNYVIDWTKPNQVGDIDDKNNLLWSEAILMCAKAAGSSSALSFTVLSLSLSLSLSTLLLPIPLNAIIISLSLDPLSRNE